MRAARGRGAEGGHTLEGHGAVQPGREPLPVAMPRHDDARRGSPVQRGKRDTFSASGAPVNLALTGSGAAIDALKASCRWRSLTPFGITRWGTAQSIAFVRPGAAPSTASRAAPMPCPLPAFRSRTFLHGRLKVLSAPL